MCTPASRRSSDGLLTVESSRCGWCGRQGSASRLRTPRVSCCVSLHTGLTPAFHNEDSLLAYDGDQARGQDRARAQIRCGSWVRVRLRDVGESHLTVNVRVSVRIRVRVQRPRSGAHVMTCKHRSTAAAPARLIISTPSLSGLQAHLRKGEGHSAADAPPALTTSAPSI